MLTLLKWMHRGSPQTWPLAAARDLLKHFSSTAGVSAADHLMQDPVLQSYNQSEQAFQCFLDLVHLQQQQQQQQQQRQTGSGSEAGLWMLELAQKLLAMSE